MKTGTRILLVILCAAMVLALPFVVSSPAMLGEAKWDIMDRMDSGLLMFLPRAYAEETPDYTLPVELAPGYAPSAEGYTDAGYEDDSIRVQMETREENGVVWRIAWVEIASPTQLRTAIAGKKVTSEATALVRDMANKNLAVVAINGDYYSNNPTKTSFEYRMGQKIRAKSNRLKDILIIDENGDFHTFIKSQGAMEFEQETGHTIVNAFTFGPALVQNGELLTMDKEYGYDPNDYNPRTAIGQNGPLSYVLVVAEGRGNNSKGATHQSLADFMYGLGCVEAYNLDGGGTSVMVFNGEYYNKLTNSERATSDIIYFATAVESKE